ncbi:hypothetical protein Aperf_G00000116445 [Anoplocephala perfoliata]
MHRTRLSSAAYASESDIQERPMLISNGKADSLHSSSSSSSLDPSSILDGPNHSASANGHSCMPLLSPITPERSSRSKRCYGASASIVEAGLLPGSSVPKLPGFEKTLGYKPPFIISVESRTSPIHCSTPYSGSSSHSSTSNDRVSIYSSSPLERVRRRRSLGESIVDSLKKKMSRLRCSLKPCMNEHCMENPLNAVGGDIQSKSSSSNEIGPIQVSLLCVCEDGSYLIQLHRDCNYQPFGIYFRNDSQGLYISRIAKRLEMKSSENYLRVNARVLEVQGVPSQNLDSEGIRELLKGSLVLTLKLRPVIF